MMNIKMVTSCPPNVDTIVRFMKYDSVPTFSDPAIQEAFDTALGGDDYGLKVGAKLNELKSEFDKYMIKKADYTEKEIHVFANEDISEECSYGCCRM